MTILRLVFHFVFGRGSDEQNIIPAFLMGIRYDLRIVGSVALLLFILGCIRPLHPIERKTGKQVAFILLFVFFFAFCLLYISDFAHYSYLRQRLNASVLNYLEDAAISLQMVWESYPVAWLIIALVGGVALLLFFAKLSYNFVLGRQRAEKAKTRLAWSVIFFLLVAIAIFGRIGQYPLRWSDAYSLGNDYAASVAMNPFQSFFSSLKFRKSGYDDKVVKEVYAWMSNYLEVDAPDANAIHFRRTVQANDSVKRRPNVILVLCESFSGYKSSAFGNPLNTTPFFDSLATKGIFFSNCFTPSYGTARGVWATITGTPDAELSKTASRNPAMVDQHTIINDFKGYEKYYFLGGSSSWANIRGLLTNNIHGLKLFEEEDYRAKKIDVWGISDKNLFLEAHKELAKEKKPFFAIIQTADNHRPYTIPEEDLDEFSKLKVPLDSLIKYGFESVDEYNAFRYTDFGFKKFMEAAATAPYFNNTLFVFIGDHGIRGNARAVLPVNAFTEQGLTAMHVPLLFYQTRMNPQKMSDIASQVDVLPTIASLSGISYTNTTLGRDLLSPHRISNAAFYYDVEGRRYGVIKDGIFFSRSMTDDKHHQACSIHNDTPVNLTPVQRAEYDMMTRAIWETSRFMLLNNKKK